MHIDCCLNIFDWELSVGVYLLKVCVAGTNVAGTEETQNLTRRLDRPCHLDRRPLRGPTKSY
jgi:hypothetical protein